MATRTEVAGREGSAAATQPSQQPRRAQGREAPIRPPVDIYEDSNGITLLADMPGVSKDRLNLKIDGNSLVIEGSIEFDLPEKLEPLYADLRSTHFHRSFALSRELEADKIEANLKDGVLRVHIPKRPEVRPRKIEVQAH